MHSIFALLSSHVGFCPQARPLVATPAMALHILCEWEGGFLLTHLSFYTGEESLFQESSGPTSSQVPLARIWSHDHL